MVVYSPWFKFLIFASLWTGVLAWYVPLAHTSSLSRETARTFTREGQEVVLALNITSQPVGFYNYCPHRGASFATAKIINERIRCNYHNYGFDINSGSLSDGVGVLPGCGSLKIIPLQVRDNIVWGCLDGYEDPAPPEPRDKGKNFRSVSGAMKVRCTAQTLVENVIDCIHISSGVHKFGNQMKPVPVSYEARRVNNRTGIATFLYEAGGTSMFSGPLHVENWFEAPATAGTTVTQQNGDVKTVQVHAVNIDDKTAMVFWSLTRNFMTHPIFDHVFKKMMRFTLDEDRMIIEKCSPSHGNKFNSKFDRLQLLYRQSLRMLQSQNITPSM